MALLKSMPPVEQIAVRNKTEAAYQAGTPVTVETKQDTFAAPTYYGSYIAPEPE